MRIKKQFYKTLKMERNVYEEEHKFTPSINDRKFGDSKDAKDAHGQKRIVFILEKGKEYQMKKFNLA